jgi:signal transduction histidine kinase
MMSQTAPPRPIPRQRRQRSATEETETVDLGIAGWKVPVHSHIACLWESDQDFGEAVGFVEAGLRGSDHCVVVGDRADLERILPILESHGIAVGEFRLRKRLTILERAASADAMLQSIRSVFLAGLEAGAPLLRLFGNVGWDRSAGPSDSELLSYEARLTNLAEEFHCVILCLHEVRALTGMIARHGVYGRHPRILDREGAISNPFFMPFEGFAERLRAIAAGLEQGQRDREALRAGERQLRQSREELRALSARLHSVREEESTRIAREVHDEVGQLLTALRMDLTWLEERLELSREGKDSAISEKLQSMTRLLETAAESVRRIMTELRPAVLDELGLVAAVEWCVEEFQKRTGIACSLHSNLGAAAPDRERSTALFRILQEALTNIMRHSGATRVEVRLEERKNGIRLEVADNGRGIPLERVSDSRSLGLLGMRERARSLGGEVSIRGAPDRGTTVEVTVPS